MNPVVLLGVQALISLAASTAVLLALSRTLARTLDTLCPDRPAAAFWLDYARTMLVIVPLVLVLAMDLLAPTYPPQDKLRLALLASLCGLLLALYTVGRRMGQFIPVPASRKGAV